MGWLHGSFLVPHFVLFLMVLAILIPMFLDSTFFPSSKQLSRLCLICLPFCASSQAMVIVIHETSGCGLGAGGLWRISDAHCAYDPLHFVIFHPHGELGWHPNIICATPAVVDGLSSEDEQQ
jgi:hypothetical protein